MSGQRKWHNPIDSGTYSSWRAMRNRCLNPNDAKYAYYGARGVTICDTWTNDFDCFYADMGERPTGLTLDRIDGNLGYSKANCRWATRTEQQNNLRSNYMVAHDGRTQTLSAWARELNVPYYLLWNRISLYKMSPAKALTPSSLVIPWKHGSSTGYSRGCRCEPCKLAAAAYRASVGKKK